MEITAIETPERVSGAVGHSCCTTNATAHLYSSNDICIVKSQLKKGLKKQFDPASVEAKNDSVTRIYRPESKGFEGKIVEV